MRVVQLLPVYTWGDAIGNEVAALHSYFKEKGLDAAIVAAAVAPSVKDEEVKEPNFLTQLGKHDVAILHLSTAHPLNGAFAELPCQKVIRYHNITPPEYFEPYNPVMAEVCRDGLQQTAYLSDKCDYCIADSEWNKRDLINLGYKCPIAVVPVVIPLDDFVAPPSSKVLNTYSGLSGSNIVFTGRIAPNKCHHDIIRSFALYKKVFDLDAKLFLVGNYSKGELYHQKLIEYVDALGVRDVYFTGHVTFEEILAYYHIADAFLCMSEHEGFCVPIVEAMHFGIPIVAFDSTAVGMTLGSGGLLLQDKNPIEVAAALGAVCTNKDIRASIADCQAVRLKELAADKAAELFLHVLQENKVS